MFRNTRVFVSQLVALVHLGAAISLCQVDLSVVLREDNAQNPALKQEYDQCQAAKKGDCPFSRIYLMPRKKSTDLRVGTNRLEAVISLPKPRSVDGFGVPARLVSITPAVQGRFKSDYIQIDLTMKQSKQIEEYLLNLNPGERFEPVLEVKNLLVDRVETTFVAVIPAGLSLEFDTENSALSNGTVVFKAIYVPSDLVDTVTSAANWKGKHNNKELKPCGLSFSMLAKERAVNTLNFGFEGLAEAGSGVIEISPVENAIPAGYKGSKQTSQQLTANVLRSQKIQRYPARSIRQTTRPLRFNFGSPVVPSDFPLYLRAELNSSRDSGDVRKNLVGLDLNFNLDPESKSGSPLKAIPLFGVEDLTLAPALKLKMNNVLNVDNENSFRWFAPIYFHVRRHVKCRTVAACEGETCCSAPFFRGLSLHSGLNGEHSAYGQNQNIVIPFESVFRFAKINAPVRKDWDVAMTITTGYEAGKVVDRTSVAYVSGGEAGTQRIPIRPELFTTIGRFHGQTKFSAGLGKSSSFNFSWDRWQLHRQEQLLVPDLVKGQFVPTQPIRIGDQLVAVVPDRTLTIYRPDWRKKHRQYWSGKFVWELSRNVSFDATYVRGELPPAFQYVNKFTVGIAYQIKP